MTFHTGVITDKGRISPEYPEVLHTYLLRRFGAGCCVEFEVRELHTKRSERQNRAFHALVAQWAMQKGHAPDALKQAIKAQVFGTIEVEVNGFVAQVLAKPHSSRLTVTEFCHLIEETLRLAAEDGVWLDAPDEYRKAKEQAAKDAAKRAAKEAAAQARSNEVPVRP